MKILVALKAEYKSACGKDWKPPQEGSTVPAKTAAPPSDSMADSAEAQALKAKIDAQGEKVQKLKTAKAPEVLCSKMY